MTCLAICIIATTRCWCDFVLLSNQRVCRLKKVLMIFVHECLSSSVVRRRVDKIENDSIISKQCRAAFQELSKVFPSVAFPWDRNRFVMRWLLLCTTTCCSVLSNESVCLETEQIPLICMATRNFVNVIDWLRIAILLKIYDRPIIRQV